MPKAPAAHAGKEHRRYPTSPLPLARGTESLERFALACAEVPQPMPHLLDAVETAKILHVSARTVWTLAKAGDLPVVCIGRRRLFVEADVAAFIASRKRGPNRNALDLAAAAG